MNSNVNCMDVDYDTHQVLRVYNSTAARRPLIFLCFLDDRQLREIPICLRES